MSRAVCIVCEKETATESEGEREGDGNMFGFVHSNVRIFSKESFAYFRCAHCKSLHARDEVDLGHYYAQYPFHNLRDDVLLHTMYANFLKRLSRAGVERSHRVLDYGCGGGHFVKFLKSRGFSHVVGFDEYSKVFGDRSVLAEQYDCIVSQDVIEHVPSPRVLLDEFARLLRPGGVIALGTPNASAIDLSRPADFVHTIHAPYHRHILSRESLVAAGRMQGWKLDRFYPTMYTNTLVPFLNERFYLYYTKLTDGTLDSLMEPLKVGALMARAPVTLFWGLFGSFFSRNTDVMAMFRRV